MRDLDIRGAGNLLGAEQSGFISDIGYETYQKILEEAVLELKENEYKDLFKEEMQQKRQFVREVQIDTDAEMLIPDEYVVSIHERLSLYTKLDKLESEEELEKFQQDLRDRFGPVPKEIDELFAGLRVRWSCRELGFERVILKRNKLRCYFVENPQSPFYESDQFQQVLRFISTQGRKHGLSLKQSNRHLIMIKENVRSLNAANEVLKSIIDEVFAPVEG
jgi:transcription-repair coupling factor (superfamily II helicase)